VGGAGPQTRLAHYEGIRKEREWEREKGAVKLGLGWRMFRPSLEREGKGH